MLPRYRKTLYHISPRFISRYEHISRYRTNYNICKTNIFIVSLNVYHKQKLLFLNAFCYCFTVETSGWHYIETLKPPSLLWGRLVYHTIPSTHNLIKCQIPYVWPPPHHYTKQRHYCATIDITDWYIISYHHLVISILSMYRYIMATLNLTLYMLP